MGGRVHRNTHCAAGPNISNKLEGGSIFNRLVITCILLISTSLIAEAFAQDLPMGVNIKRLRIASEKIIFVDAFMNSGLWSAGGLSLLSNNK